MTRRPGQSILLGQDIEILVLENSGSQVRIGINAPRSIRVLRRELLTEVENANRTAIERSTPSPQPHCSAARTARCGKTESHQGA